MHNVIQILSGVYPLAGEYNLSSVLYLSFELSGIATARKIPLDLDLKLVIVTFVCGIG